MIIGIAGGTGSGKTTVVRKIIESLPEGSVTVVSQDSYYKDSSHLPWDERRAQNFDEPRAFDWPLLFEQLNMLREGKSIEEPVYDYTTCSRLKETKHIEPRSVIILEGIMALVDPSIRAILDMKVFVDADSDERLIRVLSRTSLTDISASSSQCTICISSLPRLMPTSSFLWAEATVWRSMS